MTERNVPFRAYDELGLFHENAAEVGLPWRGPPAVARHAVEVAAGQRVSALVWGRGEPELVLLHGGAQNAHTWDTVALALGRPLVALDLPGHGRSDWRDDHDYGPRRNGEAIAAAVAQLAPRAAAVVGMSLGGLTTLALATLRPDLVRRALLVDVTPGANAAKAEPITAFVAGPESFASFDEILARTIAHNPTRSESSLRRGVLHNARAREDGRWVWRYDRLASIRSAIAKAGDARLRCVLGRRREAARPAPARARRALGRGGRRRRGGARRGASPTRRSSWWPAPATQCKATSRSSWRASSSASAGGVPPRSRGSAPAPASSRAPRARGSRGSRGGRCRSAPSRARAPTCP